MEWVDENPIAADIIDVVYKQHWDLGPGLLESVYETILARQLAGRGHTVERQVAVPIRYDGLEFEMGFRADLVVDGKVVVELKSIETVHPVHKKQVLTHIRPMDLRLGLLVNFGSNRIKDGICRLVNRLPDG